MLTLLLLVQLTSRTLSICNYTSKWTINGYTLDLSTFQAMGLHISGQDGQNTYAHSPVNNLLYNSWPFGQMLQQLNDRPPGLNYQMTLKDIEPTISFNKQKNIVWNFDYSSNVSFQYICNPYASKDPPWVNFTDILEVLPGKYLFQISSTYFCPENAAPSSINKNRCTWTDPVTNLYTLNLTSLYGEEILLGSAYKYSVCSNLIYVDTYPSDSYAPGCAMFGNQTYIQTFWDPTIMPSYNITNNSWTFKYFSWSDINNYQIKWICDQTVDDYYVVGWTVSNDIGTWSIRTKYACNKGCYFMSNDGKYNLDLSSLSGELISGIDDNLQYSIQYTPCSNYVQCNNTSVMAMRWDIQNRDCGAYLAMFDGTNFNGYNLSYEVTTEQWKFVYYNGEKCIKDVIGFTFNIYWRCDQSVSDWEVTKVQKINACEYAMYIQTNYVCKSQITNQITDINKQ